MKTSKHINLKDLLTESSMNDPVLIAMRAAKEKRAIELAKAKNKRKPLYGKERSKAQDMLWDISQDLKGLYSDRKYVLIDMEAEAGQKGDAWSDNDANRYGSELNSIDKKIEALLISRSKLEIRLLEAKDMTFNNYLDILDSRYIDIAKSVKGENGSDNQILPTRGDILNNITMFRNYVTALKRKYKDDKTKLRFITEHVTKLTTKNEGTTKRLSEAAGIVFNTGMRKIGNNPTEKKTSKHFGKATSFNDFKKLILGLPKNIKKVKVPVSLGDHSPKEEMLSPSDTSRILKIAQAIIKAASEAGNPVIAYGVNTFYSVFQDEEANNNQVNINFEYKSSKPFADRMAADKFLD